MFYKILVFLLIFAISSTASSKPCVLKSFNTGLVCVCNSTYCDTLNFKLPVKIGDALIISSSKSGLRFHESHAKFNESINRIPHGPFHYGNGNSDTSSRYLNKIIKVVKKFEGIEEPLDNYVNIMVNRSNKFQKVIGFGGAFTGSVSYNLKQLPKEVQEHIYQGYYSKEIGIAYNMMRLSIGGCDFDLSPWAYNEEPVHDIFLRNFTKLDDRDIEKIHQINELKKITKNHDFKVFGAAWSPPKWMKSNNDYTGFSVLRDEYYQTWADYHVKYLELMAKNGLPFWAISTGNEPLNGLIFPRMVPFMSLGWHPMLQGIWIADNLGPAMKKSEATKDIKILAGDDQRFTIPTWLMLMDKARKNVSDFIDGIAVHWYADRIASTEFLDMTADMYPKKFIISTEACSGFDRTESNKIDFGTWHKLEDLVLDVIEDFNHFVTGWVDWNLVLDEFGGPNYINNFVDAAIIAAGSEIYKQPTFYGMGHFSRFIPEGSVRIRAKSSSKFVKTVGFLRPDGYTVIILYNLADISIIAKISDKSIGSLRLEIPSKSLHSIIYKS
ncbi:lysosomal acid glucosylceramidase-like [Chironomus tepperi]|uniref:lysosomal acid glucosylceramidase-like n=1 Tax=Chironomus tepperi TaxID=113505 RepID=UPI00391EFBFF